MKFCSLLFLAALSLTTAAYGQTRPAPEENRFTKTVLSNDLNEPMELAIAPDGRVFFVERTGKFYVYEPTTKKTRLLHDFPVKAVDKYLNGLLGMTIDPNFAKNQFLYFFYTGVEAQQHKQLISRIKVAPDGSLDLASEKVIIEVPIDLEVSAHTGGSLAWDTHRNLFISTGDNTVPFESNGFAPIDRRPNRLTFDAERSAGNPNDLRGKILRIHVEENIPDSGPAYTVPDGNLFAKGTPGTRPEIYVMGCRNPYRISVDPVTDILYWGEIGPDSGTDGPQGPRGYDEFNQARKAGNYGWPYFVGDNKAYHQYDFATKAAGPLFDGNGPTNNSPNNTGAKTLPSVQKAMVWYPYNESAEFPELGKGGRCAIGGPVYHYDPNGTNPNRLPDYYDKAVLGGDWMRNWVFAMRLDDQQKYKSMDQFMPTSGDFRRPVDIEISADGVLYMLEYGSVYGIDNVDARLVRVDFNRGNRAPVALITTPDSIGMAPLTVAFSSKKSYDFDADRLRYEWRFENNTVASTEPNPTHIFRKNGVYTTTLTVTDPAGLRHTDTLLVRVGNTMPQVAIQTTSNRTFFFPEKTSLNYTVSVTDKEDRVINKNRVLVAFNYLPKVSGSDQEIGHQMVTGSYNLGKNLMAASDCKACHQLNAKSVGPAFVEVAKRYRGDDGAVVRLANKVIVGGGGVWGEHAMNAHPQLAREDAAEIVKYVLSLGNEQADVRLPQRGSRELTEHLSKPQSGRYVLTALYTDGGGAIAAKPNGKLTQTDVLILRPARVEAGSADVLHRIEKQDNRLGSAMNGSYFVFKNVDLTDIQKITYRLSSKDHAAAVDVHLDSPTGPAVSSLAYNATGKWDVYSKESAPVKPTTGLHDLYFVVHKDDTPADHLISLDWIEFGK